MTDTDSTIRLTAEQLRASLVKLASGELVPGIRHEPRAFFDIVPLKGQAITQSHADVFKNGEQFPIRLTHFLAAVAPFDQQDPPVAADERQLQRIGIRANFHDQNYMNSTFIPIAAMANKPVASPPNVVHSTSAWKFDIPYILSARDTLDHHVQLLNTPTSAVRVTITHTGIGLLSGRPYLLTGTRDITDTAQVAITPRDYRNDGAEPIIVSDVTVQMTAPIDDDEPAGDLRGLLWNVQQVGNGTQAVWFEGPKDPPSALMPAVLGGVTSGQALVHRWPGDGLIWEPGEGIDLEFLSLNETADDLIVWVALTGYLTVN